MAQSAADVQAAVAFAAGRHRPVLVKTTGHQMVGAARGAVVIATHRMNDVVIDTVGHTARVGAGALWAEVVAEAAKVGLAPLNGSNPTVGVSGYPGRRPQLDPRPLPRLRGRPRALARGGDRGRRTAAGRRRVRTRTVLGAARWKGQLRRGDRAGVRLVPGAPPLRRRPQFPR
ncbi:FAD-binding oxidoreductase [Amycolatopsis carbonis]|uniref:FAD-binding oxidoreductase n=1 Tax=Amycolatopsis carbonis TaxID=715471 RepID=UPI00333F062C